MTDQSANKSKITLYRILVDDDSELYKECKTEVDRINANVRKGTKLNIDDWYMSHCFEKITESLTAMPGSKEIDSRCLSSPHDYCLFQVGKDHDLIRAERSSIVNKETNKSDSIIYLVHSTQIASGMSLEDISDSASNDQSVQTRQFVSRYNTPDYIFKILKDYKAEIIPLKSGDKS